MATWRQREIRGAIERGQPVPKLRARQRYQLEPCRRWTATIKYKDDPAGYRTITTTIHGPNPTEAERRYCAEHPDVSAIIIRAEQYA